MWINKEIKENSDERFKKIQKESLDKTYNPSIKKKIKLWAYKQYWKWFMPDYIQVREGFGGPYYCVETDKGTYSICARNNLTLKEIKKEAKKYANL